MKKVIFGCLCIFALVSFCNASVTRMPNAPERVIGLHIGAKNPTFDETVYPDFDFFYTPDIKGGFTKPSGEPELVVNWIKKGGLKLNQLILTDKNGIVDFTGFLVPGKKLMQVQDLGYVYTLEEALDRIVVKGISSLKKTDKPINWEWVSDIEGRYFPPFEVVDSKGEKRIFTDIIGREKPRLVLVFNIPYSYKFQEVEEHMDGTRDIMQLIGGIAQVESGIHHVEYLKMIENDLYGR